MKGRRWRARVDNKHFNIISLESGNRWSDAAYAEDVYAITLNEFSHMVGDDLKIFLYAGYGKDVVQVKKC